MSIAELKHQCFEWLMNDLGERGFHHHTRALAFIYFNSEREVSDFDRFVVEEILDSEEDE